MAAGKPVAISILQMRLNQVLANRDIWDHEYQMSIRFCYQPLTIDHKQFDIVTIKLYYNQSGLTELSELARLSRVN